MPKTIEFPEPTTELSEDQKLTDKRTLSWPEKQEKRARELAESSKRLSHYNSHERSKAYQAAFSRLRDRYPNLFRQLYAEELLKRGLNPPEGYEWVEE